MNFRIKKMPKDRKRAPSTSDSDSGPDDKGPVKKVKEKAELHKLA